MKYNIKLFCIASLLLSISAICLSLRFQPFELSPDWMQWGISISTVVLSIAVSVVLVVQVYNSFTLERRIREASEKLLQEKVESLKISDARSAALCMFHIKKEAADIYVRNSDLPACVDCMKLMLHYALALNDLKVSEILASTILSAAHQFDAIPQSYFAIIQNLARSSLPLFPADHALVPQLYSFLHAGTSNNPV